MWCPRRQTELSSNMDPGPRPARAPAAGYSRGMPKKQKRREQEIQDMIVRDAKIRRGCTEFEPIRRE